MGQTQAPSPFIKSSFLAPSFQPTSIWASLCRRRSTKRLESNHTELAHIQGQTVLIIKAILERVIYTCLNLGLLVLNAENIRKWFIDNLSFFYGGHYVFMRYKKFDMNGIERMMHTNEKVFCSEYYHKN